MQRQVIVTALAVARDRVPWRRPSRCRRFGGAGALARVGVEALERVVDRSQRRRPLTEHPAEHQDCVVQPRRIEIVRARALSLVAFVGFLLAPASSSSALSACGWKVVPIAPHTPFSSELSGVAPISATDVWAVGFYRTNADPSGVPLAEHFDGSKWHVSSPPAQAGALVGVSRVPGTKR